MKVHAASNLMWSEVLFGWSPRSLEHLWSLPGEGITQCSFLHDILVV